MVGLQLWPEGRGAGKVWGQTKHQLCAVPGTWRRWASGAMASGESNPHAGLTTGPETGPRESALLAAKMLLT